MRLGDEEIELALNEVMSAITPGQSMVPSARSGCWEVGDRGEAAAADFCGIKRA